MLHPQLLNGLEIKLLLRCCCNKQLAVSTIKQKGSSALLNPKSKTGVYLATTIATETTKGLHKFDVEKIKMMNNEIITTSSQENVPPSAVATDTDLSTTTSSSTTGDQSMKINDKVIKKYLAAFDFDYTVVAQNTDTVIRDLLPPDRLTKDMQDIIEVQGWTEYMAEVFRRLHACHIKPDKILQTIHGIPEVPGFVRMLKRLNTKYGCDLIVISDSNSLFIEEWIKSHGLQENFTKVFTNPAQFDDAGLLTIKPYHHQTDCRLSAVNLCKGKVLEHFMIEQDLRHNITYERVIYVGDGNNDICPVTKLRNRDVACAREGFAMAKTLAKNPMKLKVRAEFIIWKSGFDLLDQLERHMNKLIKQQEKEQEQQQSSVTDIAQTSNTETTKVH
ncbi:pyridoxal phosphate phosphatase PHOSPHO2 [Calliphora vicina]|uniref:pyridoxal phosphate phosphatase PHOSPHO2 n=1 Tax=Calliphora vicina TaxID=7373 RepID=UPI00325ACE89